MLALQISALKKLEKQERDEYSCVPFLDIPSFYLRFTFPIERYGNKYLSQLFYNELTFNVFLDKQKGVRVSRVKEVMVTVKVRPRANGFKTNKYKKMTGHSATVVEH